MVKADLVNDLANLVGTKKKADEVVSRVFELITDALKRGESVKLVGFGTFKVVNVKARKGRNPSTGESITIEAKRVPRFAPGTPLKEAVNGK